MLKHCLTLIIFIYMIGASRAQLDNLFLPVFADNVVITANYPIMDSEAREIYRIEADGKYVVEFPEDVDSLQVSGKLETSQDEWLVLENMEAGDYRFWRLNFANGSYHPYEFPCEIEGVPDDYLFNRRYTPVTGAWTYVYVDEQTYLCNITTGEVSSPLPDGLVWGYDYFIESTPPPISPDGRHLAIIAYEPLEQSGQFQIYSYDTESNVLRHMGQIGGYASNSNLLSFSRWVENRYFILSLGAMPEWSRRYNYVADALTEGSLDLAITGWRFTGIYRATPPRLEYMISDISDGPTSGPCILEVYYFQIGTQNEFDTGSLCEYGLPIPDSEGFYLYRSNYPRSSIVSFNPVTGEQHVIYTGEVEGLYSLSPAGQYALIALDDRGIVSNMDDVYEIDLGFRADEYFVLNIEAGTFAGTVLPDGIWLTDNAYLAHDNEKSVLHEIVTDTIEMTILNGNFLATLPDGNILLHNTTNHTITRYNLREQTYTAVVSNLVNWQVQVYQALEDSFTLSLIHASGDQIRYELAWR